MSTPTPRAVTPARVLKVEIAPPPGADLRRSIECAQGILAEFEADRAAVEFVHGRIRVRLEPEGV